MSNVATLERALGHPAIRFVTFNAFHRQIRPASYQTVIQNVRSGAIGISAGNMPPGASAYYDPAGNVLMCPFEGYGGTAQEQMLLVHECTHAILDIAQGRDANGRRRSMREWQDEAIAYVAAALYGVGRGVLVTLDRTRPTGMADQVVRDQLSSTDAAPTGPVVFSDRDLVPLRNVLRNDPHYGPTANDRVIHDGV